MHRMVALTLLLLATSAKCDAGMGSEIMTPLERVASTPKGQLRPASRRMLVGAALKIVRIALGAKGNRKLEVPEACLSPGVTISSPGRGSFLLPNLETSKASF
jgi:hypothetical protein